LSHGPQPVGCPGNSNLTHDLFKGMHRNAPLQAFLRSGTECSTFVRRHLERYSVSGLTSNARSLRNAQVSSNFNFSLEFQVSSNARFSLGTDMQFQHSSVDVAIIGGRRRQGLAAGSRASTTAVGFRVLVLGKPREPDRRPVPSTKARWRGHRLRCRLRSWLAFRPISTRL